ncbi:hypothetical protein [Streptomyces sp. TLI_185]|uniref:hypothetical protein n=1 Tax=Streptomyces sp. TLI_185 TaxID=2485151 RepID=UPI000FB07C76|nr:hypothetical protein [Streptomyces sp. TLI_185]RPF39283.1 hypothetical protein EDD92_9521 [Streptomyces sp. TLI_185]
MEDSKSQVVAQARPVGAETVTTLIDQTSAVRIEDGEDEGPDPQRRLIRRESPAS